MLNKNIRKKLGIVCLTLAMSGIYACGKTDEPHSLECGLFNGFLLFLRHYKSYYYPAVFFDKIYVSKK